MFPFPLTETGLGSGIEGLDYPLFFAYPAN